MSCINNKNNIFGCINRISNNKIGFIKNYNYDINNIGNNDKTLYLIAQNIRNVQKLDSSEITYIETLSNEYKMQIILLYDHCTMILSNNILNN